MKEVTKAAKRANMKSRACKNCPIKQRLKICPPEIFEVCSAAFIEGFKKGVKAAQKARDLVKTMEVDYNAKNKMINSTVAHQAVRMAEIDLTKKAVRAFDKVCSDCGKLCAFQDCDFRISFIKELND